MKKKFLKLVFGTIVISLVIILLNINVTTRQGVNFKVHTIKLPLYLKVLDFFARHYNYNILVAEIIGKAKTGEERALRIFLWTHQHIKPQPEELPVIDDHVWNIIIRGYGIDDQSADVFATLCNYAGLDAFFSQISSQDKEEAIVVSFVKIMGKWYVFDPGKGVYFVDAIGRMMDLEGMRAKNTWLVKNVGIDNNLAYARFFENLPLLKDVDLRRSNIQSPFRRLAFEVKKRFGLSQN